MALPPSYSSRTGPKPPRLPGVNPNAYGGAIAEGLGRVGRAAMEAQEDDFETAERIRDIEHQARMAEDRRTIASATADRAAALATSHAEMQQTIAAMRAEAAPGAAGHEEKTAELVDKWASDFMGTLGDRRLTEAFAPDIARMAGSLKTNETIFALNQRADKQANDAETILNIGGNSLFTDPSDANLQVWMSVYGKTIEASALPGNAKEEALRQGRKAFTIRAWQGAMQANPEAALAALDNGALNNVAEGGEIVTLRSSAVSLIEHRAALARSAASSSLSEFRETQRVEIERVNEGVTIDGAPLLASAAKAEELGELDLAHDLRVAAMKTQVNARYTGATPAEMQAARREIEARPDWRKDEKMVAAHAQLGTLIDRTTERAKTDKLGLWSENGGGLAPLDVNDEASIRARIGQARAAQQRYGGPLQLMTEDEAAPIRDGFAKSTASGKADTIATFARFGNETARAAMRQISEARPEYAVLADLATMRNGFAGQKSMREALAGWEHAAANPKLIDGGKMQAQVDAAFGEALSLIDGPTRQGTMRVAQGIYANRMAAGGGSGAFDKALWLDSYQRALGAAGDGTGGIGRTRGGAAIVAPRGLSVRDVESFIARAGSREFAIAGGDDAPLWGGKPMTGQQLKQLVPVMVSNGRYAFRSRSGYAKSKEQPGSNFVIDIFELGRMVKAR